ncbi:N-acetylmuramoyl-L-alanine amidase family protein [Oecophyllibacter saccharovorans]|uniref:N-acetylmuramoyl-L-alanine amidase family protein n=1 Tax=Oecophyllibacter saccharovorans TaxID=2558360 RepID=UPI00116A663D|nr:N-acetylmuramoyl-L-alanine amidase [Oecophyllibacter saccharovorans]TPW36628.1 N-acetylmuramoyl-L-alanine amidase [Oecophyllibacter saccharovorans]
MKSGPVIRRRALLEAVLTAAAGTALAPQTALARVLSQRHAHVHARHHAAGRASHQLARHTDHSPAPAALAEANAPAPAATAPARAPAVLRGAAPPRPLVMIDPGHGGKDPGAIGVSGTYEKHVAEAAALELRRQLLASGRYRVAMTRSGDRFIPLDGRVELAHRHQAGLFISLHADALPDSSVRGASVYTLSGNASDRQTAALAQRENSADRFASAAWQGVSPEVAQILGSLVREETRHGSTRMAGSVVQAFRNRIGLLSHPARHAGFVVLKSADIPSVLVEMGFMSNPHDEAALRQSGHRQQVALAMKAAVDHYFNVISS